MSETPNPDRLSDLPESILFHILSFLPTKYVVQMSILSRRWRYLWTSVPSLNFGDDLFQLHRVSNGGSVLDANTRFVNFVNKVLQLHDMSHIQRFRISCFDLDISWISAAVKKNVQELFLIIPTNAVELPDCLFTCESLVSLKLVVGDSILALPTSVCFTRLRTLLLFSVTFNGFFGKLLSGCPVLDKLAVVGCQWWDDEVVNISSPTLRHLIMCSGTFSGIKISNPNLISFQYKNCFGKNYFIENLSSLVDAVIDVDLDCKYCSKRYKECFHEVSKLLRGVSNARSLTLSDSIVEQLSNAPNLLESLPTFQYLNKLMLSSCRKKEHFHVIAYLLRSSPILESLVIDMKPSRNYVYEEEGNQQSKRLCLVDRLHDHLKEVKIRCFGGTEDELEFVKLLLSNASTLERVFIIEWKDLKKRNDIDKKLVMFQMASTSCIVSIS
ncbi:F-box domain [Macleaya cordata]|uniref:F-box domain n=1 Tax=Macleaya cordata TaxID=56857 RepID=A0A200QMR9_MACCD|nr:F-box domain [Macleaya cordata]